MQRTYFLTSAKITRKNYFMTQINAKREPQFLSIHHVHITSQPVKHFSDILWNNVPSYSINLVAPITIKYVDDAESCKIMCLEHLACRSVYYVSQKCELFDITRLEASVRDRWQERTDGGNYYDFFRDIQGRIDWHRSSSLLEIFYMYRAVHVFINITTWSYFEICKHTMLYIYPISILVTSVLRIFILTWLAKTQCERHDIK